MLESVNIMVQALGDRTNPPVFWLYTVSQYDQEILQSQTADNPWHRKEEPLNHHETPERQIKQSNQLSLPH